MDMDNMNPDESDNETQPDVDDYGQPIAPVYSVPDNRIVGVEHPMIIRNLHNGLKSLGGEHRMKSLLDHQVGDSTKYPLKPLPEPECTISLRPNDPWAQKIPSEGLPTRNILVRVTVPKRTGRKRKRGSDDPFTSPPTTSPTNHSITAPQILQRIRESDGNYEIEPVGMVRETHRFRNPPDFQIRANDVPIFQELETSVLKPSYSNLKNLNIDLTPGAGNIMAFPGPPKFATVDIPHRYEYQQAAGVRFTKDDQGNLASKNTQLGYRKKMESIAADAPTVPQAPPPHLKAFGNEIFLNNVIDQLKKLLDSRPLVTKRVAMNHIPPVSETIFKEATQYVGYSFKAGPWRDSLIRYGVDPRSDPKYRFYQTLMFQLDKRAARASGDKTGKWNRSIRHIAEGYQSSSHIFDGEHVTLNGKTWHVIDVTDPLLAKIFATTDLPEKCDPNHHGWFYSGTVCKARVIMRDKMEKLFDGLERSESEHRSAMEAYEKDYEAVARLPDLITNSTKDKTYLDKRDVTEHAIGMANEVRSMAKNDTVKRMLLLKAQLEETRARAKEKEGLRDGEVNPELGRIEEVEKELKEVGERGDGDGDGDEDGDVVVEEEEEGLGDWDEDEGEAGAEEGDGEEDEGAADGDDDDE